MTATVLTLLGGLAALVKWLASYFSDGSKLRRLELYLERQKARLEVERERLKATYERIEREPPKPPAEVVEDLNEKFGGGDANAPKP